MKMEKEATLSQVFYLILFFGFGRAFTTFYNEYPHSPNAIYGIKALDHEAFYENNTFPWRFEFSCPSCPEAASTKILSMTVITRRKKECETEPIIFVELTNVTGIATAQGREDVEILEFDITDECGDGERISAHVGDLNACYRLISTLEKSVQLDVYQQN